MARHQVHRSRWIACRRRSAAPSITILVFSRGKTVEKCAVGRPPGFLLIPSRAARSGGKVVVLCHPLLVLPASAVLLDLSISLLGYEALVCWICVSAARVDMFVIVAPDPSCESPS